MKHFLLIIVFLTCTNLVTAAEWSGQISAEGRYYQQQGDFGQSQTDWSLAIEPEFYHEFEDADLSITFKPFYRFDEQDSKRSHGDIRELMLNFVADEWELKAGIGKVYWGVAESQHLVDIINQTDLVENVDGEDKLGQPMVHLSTEQDWGLLEFFVLPGFRERTFAGQDGRLRSSLVVDTDNPLYADSDEDSRLDGAIRWSHSIGDWEIGLSHFSGTSRDPLFLLNDSDPLNPNLTPFYVTIDQTGIDLQATIDAWLWKLEAISRSGYGGKRYWQAVGGFEYSFYGITENGADLGLIAEIQTDSRDTFQGTQIQDSLVTGFRLALNDEQSTEALLGFSYSEEGQTFVNLEASRRLGDSWKLIIEARMFGGFDHNQPQESFLYSVRNDDYISISLEKYF